MLIKIGEGNYKKNGEIYSSSVKTWRIFFYFFKNLNNNLNSFLSKFANIGFSMMNPWSVL